MDRSHQFCSGLSRHSAFVAITRAGVMPGIQVGDLTGALSDAVLAHVRVGGGLFVDSGAFPAFMAGGRSVDFDAVLGSYRRLVDAARDPGSLLLVAPDKVGDPVATHQLLLRYAPALAVLSQRGATFVVPVQLGSADLVETWTAACGILPGVRLVPGMPMRAAAVSVDQVVRFLHQTGEARVHLLGTSKRSHFDTIGLFCAKVTVTADANRIRAAVGAGRPLTENYRELVREACAEHWRAGGPAEEDATEFIANALNVPGFLSRAEVAKLAAFLELATGEELSSAIIQCALEERVTSDLIDVACQYPIAEMFRDRVASRVGPAIRAATLTEHFSPASRAPEGCLC